MASDPQSRKRWANDSAEFKGAVQGPSIRDSIHKIADDVVDIIGKNPIMAQSTVGSYFMTRRDGN